MLRDDLVATGDVKGNNRIVHCVYINVQLQTPSGRLWVQARRRGRRCDPGWSEVCRPDTRRHFGETEPRGGPGIGRLPGATPSLHFRSHLLEKIASLCSHGITSILSHIQLSSTLFQPVTHFESNICLVFTR